MAIKRAMNAQQIAALEAMLAEAKGGAPAARGKRARKDQAPKYLTQEELAALFGAIESPRDRAIFRIAYHRGLRACEVGRLQLADYRSKAERIHIRRAKGSLEGEFRLCDNEVKALRAWLRIRGWDAGPLFPSRFGRGISRQQLDVLMKRYGHIAGLPADKRHFHCLKHSCGTHLLERGESIEDVQDALGHSNIQNTQIYAKLTNVRRDQRATRLKSW